MRGVVLAGGLGTRLKPLTNIVNKHLLPVYNKLMIYYPIETLVRAGVKEIAIVVSGKNPGQFIEVLKNGEEFGLKSITYLYQEKPDGGVANALGLAKIFANGENLAVILGDNVTDTNISQAVQNFKGGAHIFLKHVPDAERFGCPRFEEKRIIEIIEKPEINQCPSSYAVTGLYLYDNKVFDYIDQCKPSIRNQIEISDVNNCYIKENNLSYSFLNSFWHDAGEPDSLFEAGQYWYNKAHEEIND